MRSASGDLRTCLVAFSRCDAAAGRPGGCGHFPCLGHSCMTSGQATNHRDPRHTKKIVCGARFLKRDFATEPQPTYPKTNPTDPGRPGFAPTAKKSEEGPKRSPRQCSSARPEARERQQAARHTAPSPPPPPRRSRARACRAPHAQASPPTERRAAETLSLIHI